MFPLQSCNKQRSFLRDAGCPEKEGFLPEGTVEEPETKVLNFKMQITGYGPERLDLIVAFGPCKEGSASEKVVAFKTSWTPNICSVGTEQNMAAASGSHRQNITIPAFKIWSRPLMESCATAANRAEKGQYNVVSL